MKYPARHRFPWLSVWGIGYMRPASGTWGSIPPVLLAGGLMATGFGPVDSPVVYVVALAAVACIFSIACIVQGSHAEAVLGKDPSVVVADEVAGQSLALLLLPTAGVLTAERAIGTLMVGFLAFRVLDIIKPWPARQIQSVPGGWGILLDDLFAGLYALIAVQVFVRTLWGVG